MAHPLPEGFLPWRGEFVEVDADLVVTFHRCVVCGLPLTDAKSRDIGLGPNCLRRQSGPSWVRLAQEKARREDRLRWVQELNGYARYSRYRRHASDAAARRRHAAS